MARQLIELQRAAVIFRLGDFFFNTEERDEGDGGGDEAAAAVGCWASIGRHDEVRMGAAAIRILSDEVTPDFQRNGTEHCAGRRPEKHTDRFT